MKQMIYFLAVCTFLIGGCAHDEFPMPDIPPADEQFPNYRNPVYLQINPALDAAHGYSFNRPRDIYYGVDNFIYIADTDNNRIVMMDIGGAVQGVSQPIPHPEAITQNDSLALLIVNNTNSVFKIDMYASNHQISQAPIVEVFRQESQPNRRFTGITVHNGFEYYVSVTDDIRNESYIYDFRPDNWLRGPLPFEINGSGLFSAMQPTAIISQREQYLDISSRSEDTQAFLFTQTGFIPELQLQNFYKVQFITTTIIEGDFVLVPNVTLIGTDIYDFEKFYNPEDIALDRSGFIFVVEEGAPAGSPDAADHLPGFYRFSPTGKQMQALLAFGNEAEQFNSPSGIAVSPIAETDQIVFIADTGNDRILRFRLSTDF